MTTDLSLLIADLSAADVQKRIAAAEQLSRHKDTRAAAIPLVRASGDTEEQVREFASSALEELGEPAIEETAELADLLADPSAEVAYWAATLLGRCGERAAESVEALAATLSTSKVPSVRQRAAWALGEVGPAAREALPALQHAAASEDKRLARLAAAALEKL